MPLHSTNLSDNARSGWEYELELHLTGTVQRFIYWMHKNSEREVAEFQAHPHTQIFACMYYICTICSILGGNSECVASWHGQDAVSAGAGHQQPIAHAQTLEKRSLGQLEPHSLVQRHKLQRAMVRGSVLISSLLRQLPFRTSGVTASAGDMTRR